MANEGGSLHELRHQRSQLWHARLQSLNESFKHQMSSAYLDSEELWRTLKAGKDLLGLQESHLLIGLDLWRQRLWPPHAFFSDPTAYLPGFHSAQNMNKEHMTFTQRCVSLFSVNFTTAYYGFDIATWWPRPDLESKFSPCWSGNGVCRSSSGRWTCKSPWPMLRRSGKCKAQELRDFKFGIVRQIGRWVSVCSSPKVKTWW